MTKPMETEKNGIQLNKQTVGNLIDFLQEFPADAKVVLWLDYAEYDCVIACNFVHQHETNKVMLIQGDFIKKS